MASMTRAEARTLARYLANDDGTNAACTDAQVNSYLEEARQWYASTFPEEFVAQAGSQLITTSSSEYTFTASTYLFRSLDFAFNATSGQPMDKMDVVLIDQKLKLNAVTGADVGPMRSWGCRRLTDTDWALFTYPPNIVDMTINVYGHYELEPLTSDASLLIGQHSSRVIARLAALEVARAAGREPEFIAAIAAQLPDRVATRRLDVARVLDSQPMRT
jgi:hypothetical protein